MVSCTCFFDIMPFSREALKLKRIVSLIVSIYVTLFIIVHLRLSTVDGPYLTLLQSELLWTYETIPFFEKHSGALFRGACQMLAFTGKCSLKCVFGTSCIEGTANGDDTIAVSRKPGECSITTTHNSKGFS